MTSSPIHPETLYSLPTPEAYMTLALSLARRSPPKQSNFRVGAVLVSSASNTILSTGYTLELPGNTHAEQCCLSKLAASHGLPEERAGEALGEELGAVMYCTMEPCGRRLSGQESCVRRILRTREGAGGIGKVFMGVMEPETFVGESTGRRMLEEHGVECTLVGGLEEEILSVAKSGHRAGAEA
jgi:pyrimidine deaminase RibD-like protein